MGMHNEVLVGRGKNQREAFTIAWDEFIYENGHRNSYRKTVKATLLRRVPPEKQHVEKQGRYEVISMRPDPTAPQAEWLEEWEFEVLVHA